jgi:hypothetical protein
MNIKQYFSLKLSNSFKDFFSTIKKIKKQELFLLPGVIFSIIILLLIPFFFITSSIHRKYQELIKAEERIESLEIKARKTALIRSRASFFIKQLQAADKEFVKHHIESMTFLDKERKAIEVFFKTPIMKESFSLLDRKKQLEENKISLEQVSCVEKEKIQEKVYNLKTPIEIDINDLQRLLNNIENPSAVFSKERPQLIFQTFTLRRKKLSQSYELFECDFKLIERNLTEKL